MITSITLPFPTSLNANYGKHNGSRLSERYKAWRDEAGYMLKAQRPKPVPGRVTVEIALVAPDRRVRDGDNLVKSVLDLLVKHGVIEEDNNRFVRKGSFEWLDTGPACTVTVRPVLQA